jgi:hypothetical protein
LHAQQGVRAYGLTSPGHPPSPQPSKRGRKARGNEMNTAMTLNRFLTCGIVVF